jgi:hypothetical protein
MNCEHHIRFLKTAYNLICTTYPPKNTGGKPVDKPKYPVKSVLPSIAFGELFTVFQAGKGGGEQVAGEK